VPNETRTPDLPDEYLREIGKVVVSWNRIESLLHHTLVLALQDNFAQDARVVAVFTHMAFPQKLDTLKAMLLISQSSKGQIFIDYQEKIQPLLKSCQEKRNNILHQSWSVDNGIVQRFDIKARGIFKATRLDVSLADLTDTTSLMAETHQSMFTLLTIPLAPKADPQEGQ
jgi:hypothetical protein